MKFQKQVYRKSKFRRRKLIPYILLAIVLAVFYSLYYINAQLTPIYARYAEVETEKIASQVISQALSDRISNVLDVNDIIEYVPTTGSSSTSTIAKFNTEVISRVQADMRNLVEYHLEQAQSGNLAVLPEYDEIEYDPVQMEDQGGIVFLVPLGQAANIPLLGNLGPKIPIRFHVIGDVQTDVETLITDFGINSAYVEVNIILKVNVQIIVPLTTKSSVVQQKIPVALGLVQGEVPQIFSSGDGANAPSIDVPLPPKAQPSQ